VGGVIRPTKKIKKPLDKSLRVCYNEFIKRKELKIMITACELCAKVTLENALREEATRIAKMQTAKLFAEEIVSPILSQLTEVPNHLLIGYRYEGGRCGLFKRISGWSKSTTTRGNLKKERSLTDLVGENLDFSKLDYISSAGLRVLLSTQKQMNKQGTMVIRNVNETISEVFEITGFVDILTIE
jgi:anti-sigma B factor antagonist